MTHPRQSVPNSSDDSETSRRASGPSTLRASDSERQAAAVALRDHCARGCLSPDELAGRLDLAYASKTSGELQALFDDLPNPPAEHVSGWRRRALRPPGNLVAVPALAAVVALAATTDPQLLWLAWPALAVAGRHQRSGRRRVLTGG